MLKLLSHEKLPSDYIPHSQNMESLPINPGVSYNNEVMIS